MAVHHMSVDYEALVQAALLAVPRAALAQIAGNPVGHQGVHIYLGFRTDWPGVVISEALKTRFPEEIIIVLQHRFWDLAIIGDAFTVTLTFGGIAEKLVVPFAALTSFADQTAKFSLAFTPVPVPAVAAPAARLNLAKGAGAPGTVDEPASRPDSARKPGALSGDTAEDESDPDVHSNIVSFDRFRK